MRYYRLESGDEPRLLARDGSEYYDLTSVKPEVTSLTHLLDAARVTDRSVDAITEPLLDSAEVLPADRVDGSLRRPVVPDEVWAAGVTYEISEQAREDESTLPEVYQDVYRNERPEIFFKATPGRTVGPDAEIGVRADSSWNVPEPELAVVIHRGDIVGYTIGNDVSSREIEGANPLYLPQAKVYDRCCAIGPCLASPATVDDPHDLEISMTIRRGADVVFEGTTSTAEMVRTCEGLVDYYQRSNVVVDTAVLLTGTSLVPPDEFTLQPDDEVAIEIETIGTLRNPVITV